MNSCPFAANYNSWADLVIPILFKKETPLAKQIPGMRIRWGKKTFNLNTIIHCLGKAYKFPTVHFLTYKLVKTTPKPGFLCRAR